ncbi:glutathione S-transferase [Glycocaulis albus]|uniref:Glutathione S-transferase n=1 Tax=Glycocaulis albus TaxID=1382801 RepID=A0ABQ1XKN9_9PROT|nr:glutathione S-transferase family protein [Glycocaulis albus]MBV5258561.1 glutathione S-transferase family protein [Synechococcus moorigangaii CMS01]GGG96364.1 glutathione S-transferase [Glycocaulis albus]
MSHDANLILFHAPMTRSIRARWAMEEMGLDYRLERVAFDRGNVGGDEYRKIHPLQKIPALKDGDTVILESVAILEYLINRYGPTPLRVDPSESGYPRYLEWLHYAEGSLGMPVNLLLAHTTLLPEAQRNEGIARWAKKEVEKHLQLIATRGLEGRDWLAADRFTAADISVGYLLYLLKIIRQLKDAPPAIQAYWERLTALESWQKASAE